jgi:hypothetical protein
LGRRVPLFALICALFSLLVVPASAAPAEGILLRGSRSAYVDLYVYAAATIAPADVTLKTTGSYVGFYLAPAPFNRDTVGALVMPRVGATGDDAASLIKLGDSWDVQAGKYRMFLLTDGAAEVFVPIEGHAFRGYQPRGPAPVSVRRADFDVPAGSGGAEEAVPLTLRSRSLVVTAGMASSSSLTAVDHLSACVESGNGCASTYAVNARLPMARVWTSGVMLAQPGVVRGQLSLTRVAGGDAGSHVDGAVLVLTIGKQS